MPDLRELATAATPGPWMFEYDGDGNWYVAAPSTADFDGCVAVVSGGEDNDDPDGYYIAAAHPQAILALLDENDRLRAALTIIAEGDELVEESGGAWAQQALMRRQDIARAALEPPR